MRIALAAALVLAAAPALAQNAPAGVPEGRTFGDWIARCSTPGPYAVCEMLQTSSNRETGQILIATSFAVLGREATLRAQSVLPLGVDLQPGATIKVGEIEKANVPFMVCAQQGCVLGLPLDEAMVQALNANQAATISVKIGAPDPAVFTISLTGFADAARYIADEAQRLAKLPAPAAPSQAPATPAPAPATEGQQ